MAAPHRPNGYMAQQMRQQQQQQQEQMEFDGKRLRKAIARKTVDHNTSMVKYLQSRIHKRRPFIQPDIGYSLNILPPIARQNPMECVTTKFVRTSTNKMRCPIFCLAWTPEGRRLITGASSGELTLWNGLTFNFETILQAHDSPIRCMSWTNTDSWLVTADHSGYVKYWQSNMNNVKMFQAHKDVIRAISFSPTDKKFVTCSDDSTVRLWDFYTCNEEAVLRGHGADVKAVDWHPTKSLLISGSKDNQQPVKLWDSRTKKSLATIHAHKNAVTDVKWNKLNGNWLITSSRDHTIKLFDLRNLNQEVQVFKGHKKESCCLKWHPIHEGLFASGGADGYVYFWHVGSVDEVGIIKQAHDQLIWSLDWHPLGHILTTGSNDHTCKFWTRNRPGDKMADKYNLQINTKAMEENTIGDKRSLLQTDEINIPGLDT